MNPAIALPLASSVPGPTLELGWWGLVIGMLLVVLNGFFVAAEFALVKVRPTQIEPYVAEGMRRARVARHMIRHLDAYLSATQLGITLSSLALGWVGQPAFAWIVEPPIRWITGDANPQLVHSASVTVAFLVITILHIVLGELAPKSIAIRKSESTTLWVALPLFVFYKVTFPAIWVLNRTANALLSLLGIAPVSEGGHAHDEDEIRLLLASSHASHVTPQKRELLDNVFELSHRLARQIMLPRQDVVYLSTTRTLSENLRIARRSGHTRFPLCDGDLDHVIGVVHIKDLFRRERPITALQELSREIAFVPETLELDRLLRRMRTERFHMAAVIDEYGGVSGVVTLEDVIEEIVGQIQDEFDAETPELFLEEDGAYTISGGMLIEDLEAALDIEISDRDEDTIGGVVFSELGRNPAVGDRVEVGPLTIEVLEVQLNRVNTVRVTVARPATVPSDEHES
ncbi:MAG TPA: hemolysin family protein [Thermoanaerobaculia bacterium]|jgi:CBS domain containing-hemolysin-like protein|nr:hemolysin family protein [Thermoanaerobaculia bacterium]